MSDTAGPERACDDGVEVWRDSRGEITQVCGPHMHLERLRRCDWYLAADGRTFRITIGGRSRPVLRVRENERP